MKRTPWVLLVLVVLLVALPIAEVWLLIEVGSRIGVLPTLAILVAEAALGAWLMRREGARAWRSLEESFRSGRMPTGELAETALVVIGGTLLMLPGFVSDVIGFLFLLPMTRPLARHLLGFFVARRMSRMRAAMPSRAYGDIIPGHVEPDPGGSDPSGPDPNRPARRDPGAPEIIRGEIENDARH